jgi:hypothetical protein
MRTQQNLFLVTVDGFVHRSFVVNASRKNVYKIRNLRREVRFLGFTKIRSSLALPDASEEPVVQMSRGRHCCDGILLGYNEGFAEGGAEALWKAQHSVDQTA